MFIYFLQVKETEESKATDENTPPDGVTEGQEAITEQPETTEPGEPQTTAEEEQVIMIHMWNISSFQKYTYLSDVKGHFVILD